MAKRRVKTISICLQPEYFTALDKIRQLTEQTECSRSELIAQCIQVTIGVLELQRRLNNEAQERNIL